MAIDYLTPKANAKTVPLHPVAKENLGAWLKGQHERVRRWAKATGFEGNPGQSCLVPGDDGSIARVLVGVGADQGPWAWSGLPSTLPEGRFAIEGDLSEAEATAAALGWALGTYEFTRYRKRRSKPSTLVWPKGSDRKRVEALVDGIFLARDLINTPAADLGPEELAAAAKKLARQHQGKCTVISGKQLLDKNYPAIYAVGRGSSRAPRLIDLQWGNARKPKLTLVGKGVCFDTGGYDLKPSSAMLLMKKDMGGAATVLGLAHVIMALKLPVRLRVLIPAVENCVSGDAFKPLDVLQTRKGLTVEVGNTDAEGRLVLCDALAEADREGPDLIVDVATLTGAARVALGTDLPALFSNDDDAAADLLSAGVDTGDRFWRLPLHDDYRRQLDSQVADLSNVSNGRFGGAITAALFLREFVTKDRPWLHVDTMAWNLENRPGRPTGGEALGLRAMFAMLQRRYGGR